MRLNLPREFYLPKGCRNNTPITRDGINGAVYTYEDNDKYYAVGFRGKSNKPAFHYSFRSEVHRINHINDFFDGIKISQQFKAELKASRDEKSNQFKETISVGDCFYSSWGYDQTNIDYVVIVSISPTRKTVICKEASQVHVGESGHEDLIMPGNTVGKQFRLKVGDGSLIGSLPGYRMTQYFHPTGQFSVHRQTDPVFGH